MVTPYRAPPREPDEAARAEYRREWLDRRREVELDQSTAAANALLAGFAIALTLLLLFVAAIQEVAC